MAGKFVYTMRNDSGGIDIQEQDHGVLYSLILKYKLMIHDYMKSSLPVLTLFQFEQIANNL